MELPRIGVPSEDGAGVDPGKPAEAVELVSDLRCKLAGRRDDDQLDADIALHVVHDRKPERRRFSCPGVRLRDHVAALQNERDSLRLDRTRLPEARLSDTLHDIGLEAESLESSVCCHFGNFFSHCTSKYSFTAVQFLKN